MKSEMSLIVQNRMKTELRKEYHVWYPDAVVGLLHMLTNSIVHSDSRPRRLSTTAKILASLVPLIR